MRLSVLLELDLVGVDNLFAAIGALGTVTVRSRNRSEGGLVYDGGRLWGLDGQAVGLDGSSGAVCVALLLFARSLIHVSE